MSPSTNVPSVAPDAASAAEACARRVLELLDEALSRAEFATFAISGGSTPKLLFGHLAGSAFPWARVRLFWVDERCVPPTDEASNYKLALEHLIAPARIRGENIHRIEGELDPKQAAERYSADIRNVFALGPGELPRFDVMHRGIGPDAHTASLFPGEPLIADREGIAGPAYAQRFRQWRVTLLPGVLMAARNTVMLAAGVDKADAVRAVFREPFDPIRYPAQIAAAQAAWFLDAPAASLL